MTKPIALSSISTPLIGTSLIEASAGTGKTYTMGSLYLRLLLQVGENSFTSPLNVEQILVVTFTEAATEELRMKIRDRVQQARVKFEQFLQTADKAVFDPVQDQFLLDLLTRITDLPLAVQRLKLAEQNMDLASIYTIHGFCHKMLAQYAFNSGIQFNVNLIVDESALLQRLSNEFWRENFYPLPFLAAEFVQKTLGSPDEVLKKIKPHLKHPLCIRTDRQGLGRLSLAELIQKITASQQQIIDFKALWDENRVDIETLIENERTRKCAKGEKRLNRQVFSSINAPNWLEKMTKWSSDPVDLNIPEIVGKYFCQTALNRQADEGVEPLQHPVFTEADNLIAQQNNGYAKMLLWHYCEGVREKLIAYKRTHSEKNFDDLLRLLKDALCSENSEQLATFIRYQYPFAMIDEFQDTDAQQYQIFATIYADSNLNQDCGFIMIGDPKQAIYKFRGADIFAYLNAAELAGSQRFNLDTNHRSIPEFVQGINHLFDFPNPFLYEKIPFYPVEARDKDYQFILNQERQPAFSFYFADKQDNKFFAEICANQIQQCLKSSAENQAFFIEGKGQRIVKSKDIAILVRDYKEAELIKKALQVRGIASVYLSDHSNVFDSQEAKDLLLILQACLTPNNERAILNAIACHLLMKTATEIQHIKQDDQFEKWVIKFEQYKQLWQQQGVLVMLHRFFLDEQLPAKLFTQIGGERRLTDLLHLAELLQQGAVLNETEDSLLRWYERLVLGNGRNDEQKIRLESEYDLVKIVTIHKSKGLQYDIVWLPFLTKVKKLPSNEITTYYDEVSHQILWDLDDQHKTQVERESWAEDMRLLYVALTRSVYQVHIVLPRQFEKGWNAFLYALSQGKLAEKMDLQPLVQDLIQRAEIQANISFVEHIELDSWRPITGEMGNLSATQFQGNIERNWKITSFTELHLMNQWRQRERSESAVSFFDDAQDYDVSWQRALPQGNQILPMLTESGYPIQRTPFDFPHSAQVGRVLHRYFELCDFHHPVNEKLIHSLCDQLKLDESWETPLQQWIDRIFTTPLVDNLRLSQLDAQDMLREMQFYLSIQQTFSLAQFNRLLAEYHPLYQSPWQFKQLQGMVRGFVDLVIRHQGKYYILDYKSNFLGNDWQNYSASALARTVRQAGYDLQYLLYTLALHRYLKQRDPHYGYESHFGGVIYVFLRGMNGKDNAFGMYFDKPQAALIDKLDKLFKGE